MKLRRLGLISSFAASAAAFAAASAAPAAAAYDPRGHLYGTIETTSGNHYTGILRWGDEEAFWDDLFNGSKQDEPATGDLPRGYKRAPKHVEVFGLEISGPWKREWEQRQLEIRFGDLAEIRPRGSDRAEITLRNGETMRIEGGSNDFDDEVQVQDAALGLVKVDWNKIRSVKFAATPADAKPEGRRLKARVKTASGEFSGWLAWDSQECLSIDKLDGEGEDGDVSIEMGKIRSIERRSRRSSTVALADGRTMELSGTNDVDSSIRGILVEDARFGRVEVSWDVFDRADIEVAEDSGKGYDAYAPLGPIRARVTTVGGATSEGAIAFDLDEQEQWEMLNGDQDDVQYSIPFARVKEIRRLGTRRVEVTLDNGEKLRLEGETDVGDGNAGIAFLGKSGDDAYVPWEDVEKIEFR